MQRANKTKSKMCRFFFRSNGIGKSLKNRNRTIFHRTWWARFISSKYLAVAISKSTISIWLSLAIFQQVLALSYFAYSKSNISIFDHDANTAIWQISLSDMCHRSRFSFTSIEWDINTIAPLCNYRYIFLIWYLLVSASHSRHSMNGWPFQVSVVARQTQFPKSIILCWMVLVVVAVDFVGSGALLGNCGIFSSHPSSPKYHQMLPLMPPTKTTKFCLGKCFHGPLYSS